jgi:rubrerythrin
MPSKRVKDILEHIRSFHHRIGDRYANLSEHESDERLVLLLKYLARHEENFNECLGRYEEDAAKGILETWLQFAGDDTLDEALQRVDLTEDMDVDDIIRCAMSLDKKLVELYRGLADATAAPRVRELFENLIEMEESKDHQYARSIREFE